MTVDHVRAVRAALENSRITASYRLHLGGVGAESYYRAFNHAERQGREREARRYVEAAVRRAVSEAVADRIQGKLVLEDGGCTLSGSASIHAFTDDGLLALLTAAAGRARSDNTWLSDPHTSGV